MAGITTTGPFILRERPALTIQSGASYTATYNDGMIVCTPSGAMTINLPTAAGQRGKRFEIKNSSLFTVTIDPSGSETIDGATTYSLAMFGESITLTSDNTNWVISSLPEVLPLSNGGTKVITWILNTENTSVPLPVGAAKAYFICPVAGQIVEWTLLADQSGSVVLDIWKDTYANFPPTVADTITAAAKPTITAATKNQSSTLTGWTTLVAANDVFEVKVDSCTTISKLVLQLKIAM